jgi:HlyD family secretion protein
MKQIFLVIAILATGCVIEEERADAYGNFEAVEVTVSAEHTGRIIQFAIEEGAQVSAGDTVGLIDTTHLHLQKRQLRVKSDILRAKFPNISSELAVIEEQKRNLLREIDRFNRLVEGGAAPSKQLDDLNDQVSVLDKRIAVVESQNKPLAEELRLIGVQIEQLEEQIGDAIITVPTSGTVLLKIAEEGEMVNLGMPLFRVADLGELILRAYVSGVQLDDIRIGMEVTVLTDKDEMSYNKNSGIITWISSEAEFTPKVIQTREERTDLVYAVKIKVVNDGTLKIGMPAEVIFEGSGSTAE